MIIFIVPKNSGLSVCKELAKDISGKQIEIRGEDVPLLVSKLNKAVGITGEDLLKEFLIKNKNSGLKIIKRIPWNDKKCIFEKPTLCLLGPKEKTIDELGKKLKICINEKYKELAKKSCTNFLENKGYNIEKIYASGATEEFFVNRIVDLVIDIVYSGESSDKAGLKVYNKLFSSDIVMIAKDNGGKNDNTLK